jgi:Domain of unknown function (DUF4373)
VKWFKHDSTASLDAKLARVRLKYGMEGYGLYWFCLESIARNVETHNLSFELEEDAELLSTATNIHYERVQEMMTYMVNLGLFENCEGRITCLKMATRTDEYTQKLLRNVSSVPTISRQSPDKVPPIRTEQKRRDKNRTEQKHTTGVAVVSMGLLGFDDFYSAYPKRVGKDAARKAWNKLNPSQSLINQILNDIRQRVEQGAWCTGPGKAFIPGPAPYLNQEKWTDEIIPRPEFKQPQDFSRIAREAQEI